MKPEQSEIAIRAVWKTKIGAILIEIDKGGRRDEFREHLKSGLNQETTVKNLTLVFTLAIRDMDDLEKLFSFEENWTERWHL